MPESPTWVVYMTKEDRKGSHGTNAKEVIGVLNDLIETSKNGEEGFKECAEIVERSEY